MDGATGKRAASTMQDTACVECKRTWTEPTERWRAYLASDEPPLIGLYCPECAAREFDDA
jgi:hypothetical protein